MSHSQFHCIDSFILALAWLNLLCEQMTTGRINQVSIVAWRLETVDKKVNKDYFFTSSRADTRLH
jgi:hypothetical protein